jgi:YVTN family beta-propeller protein
MTHYSRHTVRTIAALMAAVPLSAQTKAPRPDASRVTGVALVANQESASATVADFTRNSAFNLHVGTGPHEAAISPDGKLGVLSIYGDKTPGNQLAIVDLATRKLVRTIDLGNYKRPHGAIFLPGNSTLLAVTSEATQRVLLVDVTQGSIVAEIPTENPLSHMMGITADGKHIYTANVRAGSISELDVAKRAFTRQLQVATQTEGIAVRPDGKEVWVGSNDAGTVSIVDTKSWTVVAKISGFGMPYRIGISPNGKLAAICDPKDSSVHVVDVASRKLLGNITGLGAPNGVTIAPDNRTAFVTAPDTREVVAVDLVSRTVRARMPVQSSPDGVAYAPITLPPAPAQNAEPPVVP